MSLASPLTYVPSLKPQGLSRAALRALRFNLIIAILIWLAWLIFGGVNAIHHLVSDWKIALTMVFGSLVGGGTSEGGGAVAFPVFTKLLHIAPYDARNFSLAIQSVGMGAASLSILCLRIPIERRSLLYAGIPSIVGVIFGAVWIAPLIPPVIVRTSFTVLVVSIGIALLILNREDGEQRNSEMPWFGGQERAILIAAGFLGGIVSALVGTGENSVAFMVMVLLFRINEKIATPTTVVLMTMATIPGFLVHVFWLKDFSPAVMGYWLAAIPVVAVGGPLGAVLCSRMSRRLIVKCLLFLIALELISTVILVPISRSALIVSAGTLLICGSLDWFMTRVKEYIPAPMESAAQD
ncbi:MAG: sulfite exporter TauE/SafE family protein [Acidobacteria bacterium]|nr:sulfite exporter TauE/SafE family protein [Acidobacteriota bacterium]